MKILHTRVDLNSLYGLLLISRTLLSSKTININQCTYIYKHVVNTYNYFTFLSETVQTV